MADDGGNKRHRAGSISGRLRTASDLEQCGLIDSNQKGVLKVRAQWRGGRRTDMTFITLHVTLLYMLYHVSSQDMIISGDSTLQGALEKYELGDYSELEGMFRFE